MAETPEAAESVARVVDALRDAETAFYQSLRRLAAATAQAVALRYGYVRAHEIEGRHAIDREAHLRELLSEDKTYLGLMAEIAELEETVDKQRVQAHYVCRMYEIDLALLRGPQ